MRSCDYGQYELVQGMLPRKFIALALEVTVPETNTGRRVENTKALERTLVKELGKLAP